MVSPKIVSWHIVYVSSASLDSLYRVTSASTSQHISSIFQIVLVNE